MNNDSRIQVRIYIDSSNPLHATLSQLETEQQRREILFGLASSELLRRKQSFSTGLAQFLGEANFAVKSDHDGCIASERSHQTCAAAAAPSANGSNAPSGKPRYKLQTSGNLTRLDQ